MGASESSTTIPNTISKSELKRLLGCSSRSYRQKFFTDQVLRDLDIPEPEFNRLRVFNVHQTRAIFNYFNIFPHEKRT